jgi:phage terminase small subunit
MEPSVPPDAMSGITPRQQLLVDALATGSTITKAAEQAGIARKTAYNWLETEPFRAALDQRRKELAARVVDRMAELGHASIGTLIDYLSSEEASGYEPGRVKLAERLAEKMGLLAALGPGRRLSDPA